MGCQEQRAHNLYENRRENETSNNDGTFSAETYMVLNYKKDKGIP